MHYPIRCAILLPEVRHVLRQSNHFSTLPPLEFDAPRFDDFVTKVRFQAPSEKMDTAIRWDLDARAYFA
jgi:hypothetical protein